MPRLDVKETVMRPESCIYNVLLTTDSSSSVPPLEDAKSSVPPTVSAAAGTEFDDWPEDANAFFTVLIKYTPLLLPIK